ncbi:MAG: UPF0175 family protein [Cyanobacteria bacterium SBLK]|nr:UPF0175 family protein [Cyanobacteria bacterium SBLK]
MNIIIPDKVLQENQLAETELKQEIAIFLFQTKKLNLLQASDLVQMDKTQFQDLLKLHRVSGDRDIEDRDNKRTDSQREKNSLPHSVGMGASGMGDLSERVDELLWQE